MSKNNRFRPTSRGSKLNRGKIIDSNSKKFGNFLNKYSKYQQFEQKTFGEQKLPYFKHLTKDSTDIATFEFNIKQTIDIVFSNADLAPNHQISVSYVELRNVINNGTIMEKFKKLANQLSKKSTQKNNFEREHQLAIFQDIYEQSNTLTGFANNIDKMLKTLVNEKIQWNRVFYGQHRR